MRIRRCGIVLFEPRESVEFDLMSLFKGGAGLSRSIRWLALAPHLDTEVEVTELEREILGCVSPEEWVDKKSLTHDASAIDALLKKGLLIGDAKAHAVAREKDEKLRSLYWWPIAALAHKFGRWEGLDSVAAMESNKMTTAAELRDKLGSPPPEVVSRAVEDKSLPLPRQDVDAYEKVMSARVTCRNFDKERSLSINMFARMMQRVVMAQGIVRVQDDTAFIKKNVPSGGGLHPSEAYVIAQRIEGVAPGIYHYHPVNHALEPIATPPGSLADLTKEMLAGQHWFADAPVQLILAPRYKRSFWKYRMHAKAYRAVILDVGHISQAIYMSATEMGLGAFVTSAINEVNIEKALGLDSLAEGPLAICGFGWRAESMVTTEFDPLNGVWNKID
ncbi:putative peptide maturation dehydrogenase [Xanthomonas sp. A2111]|uniref:Peptide maturation dehydrogenase n=1 Tax=Xanthomonas hawaiiensis TaxID=3003247 RepID=A0ABU2I5J7_9XANT|nr:MULTISPECIES: putative peptide maturation dehydrogenase [unclassified Xanthomonas]MBO9829727.1 putative peptide maturation dehydrogenase [Xanthomonas sp. A2111]MBO9873366.1 putative peptide maturation dehydrogenase [Xanthomonas sp. D-93]MDS9993420.1 putative peptide maturation dehydrogenase [Xanthomonas sp. A2111]WNH45155.1 putative peptide maturation dehydrogenase [Xanthomonas sp. A6251]